MLLDRNAKTKKNDKAHSAREELAGYTIIEMIVTIVVLGMVLLVVDIVIIMLIRVSYNTDSRILVRQELEFSTEVIRRSVKSANPATVVKIDNPDAECDPTTQPQYAEALTMEITEMNGYSVTYFIDCRPLASGAETHALVARWQKPAGAEDVYMTSSSVADIVSFGIDVVPSGDSGTTEVIVDLWADSVRLKGDGTPLINDVSRQDVILIRYATL